MGTLKEDIKETSDWIVQAFASDGLHLDYTIDSIILVDKFFSQNMKDGKPIKGGRLPEKGFGHILFSIGSYVGETIIKNVPGSEWITDDEDPEGEFTVSIQFPNGGTIWPMQKVMKRFQNGTEDSIYPYVHMVTKEFIDSPFKQEFWTTMPEQPKPWWKFW
jgi:hypothetical protein